MLRVGFIGSGVAAGLHAAGIRLASHPVKPEAVFSPRGESRRCFARKHRLKDFGDCQTMLRDEKIQAVVVCSPSHLHLLHTVMCIDSGKHVLIEKPVVTTLAQAQQMEQVCNASSTAVSAVCQHQYDPATQLVIDLLEAGHLGDYVQCRVSLRLHRDVAYFRQSPWRGLISKNGGGLLINQGVHFVDLLLRFFGPAVSVSGEALKNCDLPTEGEDTVSLDLRFTDAEAHLSGTLCSLSTDDEVTILLSGQRGTVCLRNGSLIRWSFEDSESRSVLLAHPLFSTATASLDYVDTFASQWDHFYTCIERGHSDTESIARALNTFKLIHHFYDKTGVLRW